MVPVLAFFGTFAVTFAVFFAGCLLGAKLQRKRDADIAWGHVDDTRNMAQTIARQIEEA